MPHPVKLQTGFAIYGADFLKGEREYGPYIAAVSHTWTTVEWYLANLASVALGKTIRSEQGNLIHETSWVAKVALDSMISIHNRLSFIDRALGYQFKAIELVATWEAFKKRLRRTAADRNNIVHGQWGISPEIPGFLILKKDDGFPEKWVIRDFENVLEAIAKRQSELYRIQETLVQAKLDQRIH